MAFHVPEEIRLLDHPHYGKMDSSLGNNGVFVAKIPVKRRVPGTTVIQTEQDLMMIIAADGLGWEHVSVSLKSGTVPEWSVMCAVKDLFWDEEDVVVQIHPKASEYVNCHPGVLHLWRESGKNISTPPSEFVGYKKDPDKSEASAKPRLKSPLVIVGK